MPMVAETPSKGRGGRFQGPGGSDHDAVAAESHETTRDDSKLVGMEGPGSQFVKRFELVEDESFWKNHNVQVIIRVRPLNNTELSLQGGKRCVRQDTSDSITWIGQPESRFTFDHVADEAVSQEELFKAAGVPMVDNCVSGYNSCMFAYGQTGSGKTHTMLGEIEGGTRRHSVNCGMTPRVFEYLFSKIQKEKEVRREEKLQFTCKCSFLEIYNEQILDLLDPSSSNLQIREDLKKGIYVENLSEFEVACARDVIQHLLQGAANRKVASTNMNRASSRSHSVFTCVIESKWESQGITHHRFSRLNLVDLAGSERQKSSGAEGERLKEATNINKSLSTLGLVIMNLVSLSNKKSLHIPYRDSKLTFLLQDSLGGNSKTIIIANISPSNCCALETLSTLKFAQRAKFIRNNAVINEEASGDVLTMRLQIQQLKQEVSRLKSLADRNEISENLSNEDGVTRVSGSPGSFKWENFQGSSSPLALDRKATKRKEFEAALAAALRRDKDLEMALSAMTVEKETAEQLANQVMDEVKGLKMRLRFREEGIKRLQAVAANKLSAESHLLQEKEELQKEIDLLRSLVDCNPKVTQFAMENLRLKEELRRLQSFVEEGEREMLDEQIRELQEKVDVNFFFFFVPILAGEAHLPFSSNLVAQLLEALDWKLMHENDSSDFQGLSQSGDYSSLTEENEFLRMQAIQNEHEVEALRKNLTSCMEAKEKLERRVDELAARLDDAGGGDREEKEREELRAQVALLVGDNNQLIALYEAATEQQAEQRKQSKEREEELRDLREENERLMGLYEAAMRLSQQLQDKKKNKEEEDQEEEEEEEEAIRALGGAWEEVRLRVEEAAALRAAREAAEERRKTTEERLLLPLRRAAAIDLLSVGPAEMAALEKREEQAGGELRLRAELAAETAAELRRLVAFREKAAAGCRAAAEEEARLRAEFAALKAAYRAAEAKRRESKEVLFAVENRPPAEAAPPPSLKKALELEEELPRLAVEIKRLRERIVAAQRASEAARAAAEELGREVGSAEGAARRAAEAEAAAEAALKAVGVEREAAAAGLRAGEGVAAEVWAAAVEHQESLFQAAAAAEAQRLCADELADRARDGGDGVLRLRAVLERRRCRRREDGGGAA
ncbi:kinesin-like protein KIN-12G [Wolffia australiana]